MSQLPNTIRELRKLIEDAQAEIERLQSRIVPADALFAFKAHLGPFNTTPNAAIERGLRAAYPILRAAWETSQPEDDGWIDWAGGECPVSPNTWVEVKFREGGRTWDGEAWTWIWLHDGRGGRDPDYDIVAYRVVKGDK